MGDTKMPGPELPDGSEIELVDASIQEQESSALPNDKTLTLPSDVHITDSQDLPDASVDKVPADANTIAAGPEEPQADNRNGDVTLTENEPETAISIPKEEPSNPISKGDASTTSPKEEPLALTPKLGGGSVGKSNNWLLSDSEMGEADEAGTPEERLAFMRELENFYKENALEFKAPKFYGEPLNCLKLWRAVISLGGYDVVTSSKLWRQVGESFHPPKTCTTVSWTFRIFYEKALLEYEKHKRQNGKLHLPGSSLPQPSIVEKEVSSHQGSGSGRARRDAAARAMQGWHAQRLLGYGEVTEPIIKDRSLNSTSRREKHLKSIGLQKQKTATNFEHHEKHGNSEADKQVITEIVDVGPPADWVKINVRESKDCFEVYALVPGLLREEVRVQSDPAGRLVITGQPEQIDNPWGITPFKKVVNLPARIDPLQTSAVVSLHGRLYVRVPFEQGSL
ncbi:AT-rich interactive domain-containing protein 5 isoform X2 [Carica papaya]|nr:AT-rich interactive domain-containing protein 5 isoform X2 [Carica papaya]XP_021902744.1 AT-rich interactive domain-containing protein 5 isoform X2 [Carica papaya]